MRQWGGLLTALLLSACASLPQHSPSSDATLTADQRFHDLQALVDGNPANENAVQARFQQALAQYRADGNYVCRHPVYAHYFARRLGQATDSSGCPESVPFYLYDHRHGGEVRYIRPDQVAAIHVLFFSNGQGIASRFGHVALRLVICPDNAPADPPLRQQACARNLFGHITLGYMGRVNELRMNLYKGIAGGYQAHLMGFPFMDTYFTNTVLKDRNVWSLPLDLDRRQIDQVVRELSEIHWSYSGRYRFFTNNCATLLQDALNETLRQGADQPPLLDADYLRPDHLFRAIKASPIAEAAKLDSLAQAEEGGFYFPSNRPYYLRALTLLNSNADAAPYASLEAYISTPAVERMQHWLDDARLRTALAENPSVREALQLVEEFALMKTDQQLTREMIRVLAQQNSEQVLQQLAAKMTGPADRDFLTQCYLRPLQEVSRERPRPDGIPGSGFIQSQRYDKSMDCDQPARQARISAQIREQLAVDARSKVRIETLSHELSVTYDNLGKVEKLL